MADPITRQQRRAAERRAAKGQPEPKRYHPPRTQRAASDHDRAKAMQVLAMAAALSAGGSHGC